MDDRTLNIVLLGAGGRGRSVLKQWLESVDCRVSAIVDPSAESIERTRAAMDGRVNDAEAVTDVAGWYGRASCDLVLINSWDPQHAENAIDCFNAGLNIMIAKPMAQTTAQADAVVDAWRRSGRIGIVDMQIRTSSVVEKAMELIREGAIGRVRLVTCFDYVGRSGVEFRHQRSRRRDMIRSWTLAKGVHFLDLLNLFAGSDPVRVYASAGRDVFGGDKPDDLHCDACDERETCFYEGSRIMIGGEPFPNPKNGCVYSKETDINDNCVAAIDYASGVRASYVECYFTPEYQTTYEIVGDRGSIFLRYAMDNRLYLVLRPLMSARQERYDFYPKHGAHGGGDHNITLQAAEAIRAGEPMHPDIRDGRYAVALAEAIDRSADERQPVDIPAPAGE